MPNKSAPRWRRWIQALLHLPWWIGIGLWVSRGGTRRVPLEINDNEILIRAVTNYHMDKGRPTPDLFMNQAEDAVSVSRLRWVEKSIAKIYAKVRVQNRRLQRPKIYTGLAFVSARNVRGATSEVRDSRSEYLGHADIVHGFTPAPPGEALPPHEKKLLRNRARDIAKAATYIQDPKPSALCWTGGGPS
jgi:hypothetical protein